MKNRKHLNYNKIESYCKNEGLNTDYFIKSNRILVNKKSWGKNTDR